MINLDHLNDEEREIIERVILRDENERLREEERVKAAVTVLTLLVTYCNFSKEAMANSGDSDALVHPVQEFVVKHGRYQTDQGQSSNGNQRPNVHQKSQVFKPVFPVNVSKELESSVTPDQQNVKKHRPPPPPVKKRNEDVTKEIENLIHDDQQKIQKRHAPLPPVQKNSGSAIKELERSMGERSKAPYPLDEQGGPPVEQRGPPVKQRGPPVKQKGHLPEQKGLSIEQRSPQIKERGPPFAQRGPPVEQRDDGNIGMVVKRLAPSVPGDVVRLQMVEEERESSINSVENGNSSNSRSHQNEPDTVILKTVQPMELQQKSDALMAGNEIIVAAVVEDVQMQLGKGEEDSSEGHVSPSVAESGDDSANLIKDIPELGVDSSDNGFGESIRTGHSFGRELGDPFKRTHEDPRQRGHFKETYVDHSVSSISTDGDMPDEETITERLKTLEEIEVGEEDTDLETSPGPLSPQSQFGYYSQTSVDLSSGDEDDINTEEDEDDGEVVLLPDVPIIKVEDYSDPASLQGQFNASRSESPSGQDPYYYSVDNGNDRSHDPSVPGVDTSSDSDGIDKNLLTVSNAIFLTREHEDSQEDHWEEQEEEERFSEEDGDDTVSDDGDSDGETEEDERQNVVPNDEVEDEEILEDEGLHDSITGEQEVADVDDTSEDSGFAIPSSLDEGLAYLGLFSRKLKSELHQLRKQGAVKTGGSESGNERVCHRCRKELGLIFDSGDICPRCNNKVCNACQVYTPSGKKWFCTVCDKQLQIKLGSPDWVGSKTDEDENFPQLHGSQLVKVALENSRANSTVTSLADENESRRNVTFDSPHHKPASSDLGQGLQRYPKHAVASNNNEALHKHWHAGSQGWGQNNFSAGLSTPRNVKRPYERSYSFDKRYVEGRRLQNFDETDSHDFNIVSRGPLKKKEHLPGQPFWWPSGPSANSVDSGVSVACSGSTCSNGAGDGDSDNGLDLSAEYLESEGSSGEEDHVKSVSTQTEDQDRTCEVYLDGKVHEVEAPVAFTDYVVLDTVQEAVIAYDSDNPKSFRNKQPKRLTCDIVGDDAEIKTLLRRDSTGSEKESTPKIRWTFFRSQSAERQKLIPNEPHVFIPVRRAPPLPDSDPSSSSEGSPVDLPSLDCSTDSDSSLDLDAKLSDNVTLIQSLIKGVQDETDSPRGGEGVNKADEVLNSSVSYPGTSMEEGKPVTSLEEVTTIPPPKKRLKAPNLNFADSEDEAEVIEESPDSLKGPDLLLLAALSRASTESDLSVILEDPEEDRSIQSV
ncbi:Synaptotagmin-like protein 5 [Holothuria leucospilota]|uniref:Synaptotagmin-like protein 5 n=1 Tax=Holothuria leucospilota TaxID=206669 RepID=A0A9Q1BIA0_HOLLE|nr:Synaptotagmin-like protein 5 [Holothuria leucospilota]